MEDEILEKYFKNGMKQKDIANELKVSKYKVSRVVTKDARYREEKENRKAKNNRKHIEYTKKYITQSRKLNSDTSYAEVKMQHEQASRELSGGKKQISNKAFRDWNSSIYEYNSKTKSYNLKKGVSVTSDVPKKIDWS